MDTDRVGQTIAYGQYGHALVTQDRNVYEAARRRIHEAYANADTIAVSFSGGKDSTVTLFLTLEVARELNRLPVQVLYYDEEMIDPDTVAYVEQIATMPEVEIVWACLPLRHSLRSESRSNWYPWNPAYQSVWARKPPDYAIMSVPGFSLGGEYPDADSAIIQAHPEWGRVYMLAGIRIQESFNRRRALLTQGHWTSDRGRYLYGKPIFDWTYQDVWYAIGHFGWPYSAYYDKAMMYGHSMHNVRIAAWGNASSTAVVSLYRSMYPDFWEACVKRIPEMATIGRYGKTKALSDHLRKPEHATWQQWALHLLGQMPAEDQAIWIKEIKRRVLRWKMKSTEPFPDTPVSIYAGTDSPSQAVFNCWKYVCLLVAKNDHSMRDR